MNQKTEKTVCNIGLLAHVDAGKTTLSEALLYAAGARRALGRVDHGDTLLDSDDLERRRGITIFSKLARLETAHRRIVRTNATLSCWKARFASFNIVRRNAVEIHVLAAHSTSRLASSSNTARRSRIIRSILLHISLTCVSISAFVKRRTSRSYACKRLLRASSRSCAAF